MAMIDLSLFCWLVVCLCFFSLFFFLFPLCVFVFPFVLLFSFVCVLFLSGGVFRVLHFFKVMFFEGLSFVLCMWSFVAQPQKAMENQSLEMKMLHRGLLLFGSSDC